MEMIDAKTMRVVLENMEHAAQEALRSDSAFSEALQALKWEIERDPQVKSAMHKLRTTGNIVFSTFVPQIRVRVRTDEGVISLPPRPEAVAERSAQLTHELRKAVCAAIMRSHHRAELDVILNEVVGASDRFEGMAAEIERAGYEVVICLDISAYAQVRESSHRRLEFPETKAPDTREEPLSRLLTAKDLKFLEALKIKS